jgi:hypothetical protein
MTIQEAHIQLQLRIDKIDSEAYDQLQPEEADVYLSLAQRRFVKQRFEPRSNQFQVGFEQSIKRIEDLRHLLREQELDTEYSSLVTLEGVFVDKVSFPEDYFLPIKGSAVVLFNEDTLAFSQEQGSAKRTPDGSLGVDYGKRVSMLRPSQQQDIHAIATSPFNGTRIKAPLYIFQGDSIHVITDDTFVVDKVNLTYLRLPTPVSLENDITIDFPEGIHDEIIDIAARMILSDINAMTSAKQQTLAKVE